MISLEKQERENYRKSILFGWFDSPDRDNYVFIIKTTRGYESWDYKTWVGFIKIYLKINFDTNINLPINPNIEEIENILLPIVRQLKLEDLLTI